MATGNKFSCFLQDLGNKLHNLGSDTLNVMLSNSAPVNTNTVRANISEIAAGNGYSAGGATASLVSWSQTGGLATLILNDATWTASGGSIGPFRYAALYNFTNSGSSYPLIAWWDYASNITVTSGNSFATLFNSTTGVLQLQ